MKHLLSWLFGQEAEQPRPTGSFRLDPKERRELIKEIQLGTFTHVDKQDVCWLTSWALTLDAMTDDCLLDVWEETVNGRS